MKKIEVVRKILGDRWQTPPQVAQKSAFAPTNIALCKYWGKRNEQLNLPRTSSLSISLGTKGTTTDIKVNNKKDDEIYLNGIAMAKDTAFARNLLAYVNLFRRDDMPRLTIRTQSNIPIAAGLASSACGFAALILALDGLYHWQLSPTELSILARLGSGSACRSIWQGFVHWHAGIKKNGMDSHGEALTEQWPDLCIGLLIVNRAEKLVSSRTAMQRTVATSALYPAWPDKVSCDLAAIKQAIRTQDLNLLGKAAEANATTMHATMLSAWPPIIFTQAETLEAMQRVWKMRADGACVYFTQDAGPNLKLLFSQEIITNIKDVFPTIEIIQPFTVKETQSV